MPQPGQQGSGIVWDNPIELNPAKIQQELSRGPVSAQSPNIKWDQPTTGQNVYSPPGGAQGERPFTDKLLDFIRPAVQALATAGGTMALGGPENPVALPGGMLAGTGTDMLMQKMYHTPPVSFASQWAGYEPGSLKAELANAAEQGVTNEIGGRIVGKGLQIGKAYFIGQMGGDAAVDAATEQMLKLHATYSQLYDRVMGSGAPVSAWLEKTFANGAKAAQMENSAATARGMLQSSASSASGRSLEDVANPITMSDFIKGHGQTAYDNLLASSNREARSFLFDASANVKKFQGNLMDSPEFTATQQRYPNMNPQQIVGIMQQMGIQAPIREIEGPVNLTTALPKVYKMLQDKTGGASIPSIPSDAPLVDTLQTILKASNAKFDPKTGQLLSNDPISANDAWRLKKLTGDWGWGIKSFGGETNPIFRDSNFKDVSHAIDSDMTNSIQTWQNQPSGRTLESFRNAKALVNQRNLLFEKGSGLQELINENNDAMPKVDAIIGDSKKLQRALDSGELDLPGGTVGSTNMRKDLAGYVYTKFTNAPYFNADPKTGKGLFNTQALNDELHNAAMIKSYKKILGSQGFADTEQLFKNLAYTQEKLGGGGLGRLPIWAAKGGLVASASLFMGHMSMAAGAGGAALSSVVLGGQAIARMMVNNGRLPRALIAAAGGEATPGMNLLSREIVGALQGTGAVMTANFADGRQEKFTIDGSGQYQPVEKQ